MIQDKAISHESMTPTATCAARFSVHPEQSPVVVLTQTISGVNKIRNFTCNQER
jgi:hypothetical protein